MIVEIVTTGTELLLGQITNTNAPYLARQLNRLGFDVLYQSTIGDNRERMTQVIAHALSRADIIITSGGLGPTQGDITKEVCAQAFSRRLTLHEPSRDKIAHFFEQRGITMPDNNLRQAMIPEGALILENQRGTAPGVILEEQGRIIINLPGPPHELEAMFAHSVIPYLNGKYGVHGTIVSRVLRTYGIGESSLEEKIKDLILTQNNPTIALLARAGEVVVRLTAKGESAAAANVLIDGLQQVIVPRLNSYIFGIDDESMELVVGQGLQQRHLSLSLAESCTGGLITSRLTDIPGSSRYIQGAIVCYSNAIKIQAVGVPEETIMTYGAVSEQTAMAMARGIRIKFGTALGVGITGIAGPDGATPEKPVGLVYIAIDGPAGLQCQRHQFTGNRTDIKFRASQETLDRIRRYIGDLP